MTTKVFVSTVETIAKGVRNVVLQRVNQRSFEPWEPGAHIDVELGTGLVGQYSVCSSTGDRSQLRIAVLDVPVSRGGSRLIHRKFSLGRVVDISEPRCSVGHQCNPRAISSPATRCAQSLAVSVSCATQ